MSPDEAGFWDGDVFKFHEPLQVGDKILHSVSFVDYEEADGITREDVLSALLNPAKLVWADESLDPDVG